MTTKIHDIDLENQQYQAKQDQDQQQPEQPAELRTQHSDEEQGEVEGSGGVDPVIREWIPKGGFGDTPMLPFGLGF